MLIACCSIPLSAGSWDSSGVLRISKGLVDMSAIGGTELPSAWGSGGATLPEVIAFPSFLLVCLFGPDF